MSRLLTSAGADSLDIAFAPVSAPPLTLAGWFNFRTLGAAAQLINVGAAGSNSTRYCINKSSADKAVATESDATTSSSATAVATILDTNVWHHICGTFADHTTRTAYLDGLGVAASTLRTTGAVNAARINGNLLSGGKGDFLIANFAIWNDELTASEVAMLAVSRLAPWRIRPQNLVSCTQRLGYGAADIDLVSGTPWIVTGSTPSQEEPVLNWQPTRKYFLMGAPPVVRPLGQMAAASIAACFALLAGDTAEVRAPAPTIHQFRTGFQTVGQPLALLHKPSARVDETTYEVRSAPPHIHQFRTGFQTVGQPLALYHKPATRNEAESYEVRSAPPYIHLYRVGYQTVGQPLALSFKPAVRVKVEQDTAQRRYPLYPKTVLSVGGMPLPMMVTSSLRLEPESQELRLSITGPSIHIFRVGYQTVAGVTLAQLHKPSPRIEAEPYEVRSPAPTLHFFRPGYATVGQPLFALQVGKRGEIEAEQARISSAPTIHSFRTGFQTVGQPLGMRSSPRATKIEVEQDSVARKAQIYPSSNLLPGGMPLPLLAYRPPRDHSLFDGAQYFGSFTDWEAYQQALSTAVSPYNPLVLMQRKPMAWAHHEPVTFAGAMTDWEAYQQASVTVPAGPQYNPLVLMQRKPMAWKHHEPVLFFGALPDWEKINTQTPDVATQSYDFQFLTGVFEVHDLNAPVWQEVVRYHTNHARLMQAFRQYKQISLTTLQFDAATRTTVKFCEEPDVWTDGLADPIPGWVDDPADSGLWAPAPAGSGVWVPPASDTGSWAEQTTPTNPWDTQQKAC